MSVIPLPMNKRENASTEVPPPQPKKQRRYTTTAKTNAPQNETTSTCAENEKIITKRRHSISSAGKAKKKAYTNFQKSMIAASLAQGTIEQQKDCENLTDFGRNKDAPTPPPAEICNMCNRTDNDCINLSSKHTTVLAVSDITRLPSWNIRQVLTSICSRCLFQIGLLTESSNILRLRCEKALESQNLSIYPPTPPNTSGSDRLELFIPLSAKEFNDLNRTSSSELLLTIATPAFPQTSQEREDLNRSPKPELLEQLRLSTPQTTKGPIDSNSHSNLESLVTTASSTPQTPKEPTHLNSPSNLEYLVTIASSTPQTSEEREDLYRLPNPETFEQLSYTISPIATELDYFCSLSLSESIATIDTSTPSIPEGPKNFNSPSNLGSIIKITSSTPQTTDEHNCSNRCPYQEPLIQLRSSTPQTDGEISEFATKSSLPNSRSISPTNALQNSMLEVHHVRNVSPLTTESGGATNKNSYQKSPPTKRLELICQFCKHVCRRKDFYNRHVRICGLQSHNAKCQTISTDNVKLPPSRIFHCTLCNFTTDAQVKVRDHKRREHCKTFKCDSCEMLCTAQVEYEFHRAACKSQQEIRLEIENDKESMGKKKIPARRKTRLYSRTCRTEETLPEEDQILQHSPLPISQTDKLSEKNQTMEHSLSPCSTITLEQRSAHSYNPNKNISLSQCKLNDFLCSLSMCERREPPMGAVLPISALENRNEETGRHEEDSTTTNYDRKQSKVHGKLLSKSCTKEGCDDIKNTKESMGKKKMSAGCKAKAKRNDDESIIPSNHTKTDGYSSIIIENVNKEESTTTNYVQKDSKTSQEVHVEKDNSKETATKKKMPATHLHPRGRGVDEENQTLKNSPSPRKKTNKSLKGTDKGQDISTKIIDVAGNKSSHPTKRNGKLKNKLSSKPFARSDLEENMKIVACRRMKAKKTNKSSRKPNQCHDESMVIENKQNPEEAPSTITNNVQRHKELYTKCNNKGITPSHRKKSQRHQEESTNCVKSSLNPSYIDVNEGKDLNERTKQLTDVRTKDNTSPLTKSKTNKSSRESNDNESMVIESINEDNQSTITTYVQRHKELYEAVSPITDYVQRQKELYIESKNKDTTSPSHHTNLHRHEAESTITNYVRRHPKLYSKLSSNAEDLEDLDEEVEKDIISSHYPKPQRLEAESTITNYFRKHPKLYRKFTSNASTHFDYYINEDEGDDMNEDADDDDMNEEEATEFSNRFSSTNEWVEVHMFPIDFNSTDCEMLWKSNREKNLYLLQRLKKEVQQQYITCFEPMCSFTAFSLNDMMLHDYLDHYKKPRFYCRKCNHCFTSKVFLDFHLDVQDYGRYVCVKCGIEFIYQCKLDQHLIQHARLKDSTPTNANNNKKSKSIKCYTCNFEFLSKDELSEHCRRQKHSWRRKFPVIKIQRSMTLRNKVKLKRKRKVTKTSRVHILKLKTKRMPSKRGTSMEKYISMLPTHLKENWLPHRIGQVEFDNDNGNQPNCVGGGR